MKYGRMTDDEGDNEVWAAAAEYDSADHATPPKPARPTIQPPLNCIMKEIELNHPCTQFDFARHTTELNHLWLKQQ